jgi:hypothetical protein
MKLDAALKAISSSTWDWSKTGFETGLARLGVERDPDADDEMPTYASPWGEEWVQAIVEGDRVERVEFLVEATEPDDEDFTADQMTTLDRDYTKKFAAAVAHAEKLLGKPAFNGGIDTKGFPQDEEANALALWTLPTARMMLTSRNDGADTPFWIAIVVKPR